MSALRYPVMTREEDETRNVLPKGNYPFTVKSVELQKTKSGAYDMLVVELLINKGLIIKDWVVFMDEMKWKLRHFAATCGLIDKYEAQTLQAVDL